MSLFGPCFEFEIKSFVGQKLVSPYFLYKLTRRGKKAAGCRRREGIL